MFAFGNGEVQPDSPQRKYGLISFGYPSAVKHLFPVAGFSFQAVFRLIVMRLDLFTSIVAIVAA